MDLEADELAFTACYFASLEIAFAPLHQVHTHFCPRLLIGEFLSFANYEPGTGGRFITCLDGAAFVGLNKFADRIYLYKKGSTQPKGAHKRHVTRRPMDRT